MTFYSEREFSSKKATSRFLNWIYKKNISYETQTFNSYKRKLHIDKCLLKKNGKYLSTGNGKGVDYQPRIGSMFESVEHLIFNQQKHDNIRSTGKDLLNKYPILLKDFPVSQILKHNLHNFIFVDSYSSLLYNQDRILYPSFMVDTNFDQIDLNNFSEYNQYSSNSGFAIGSTRAEALVHAICELIERDLVSKILINQGLGISLTNNDTIYSKIDNDSLPQSAILIKDNIEKTLRTEVKLIEIKGKLGVPTFLAVSNPQNKLEYPLYGSGSSLNRAYAAQRALTELLQLALLFNQEDMLLFRQLNENWKKFQKVKNTIKFNFIDEIKNNNFHSSNIFKNNNNFSRHQMVEYILKELLTRLRAVGLNCYYRSIYQDDDISVVQTLIPSFDRFNLILEGKLILPNLM
ncbi:YcaO-like family protein [Oenococcus oeni]|uniref:YcaO-like family protein n=1 Tax=Oenococcus oeni TaxID=1247 RepID=UPI0010B04518|nr:YcaO-like family protein [Oenococcus oeni]SYW14946.1 conserved hypothetical protein [Oenococcus oeni]